MAMAMGTCRCRPEAERHSPAAATGAVAIGAVRIGAAVTNSSLPVDLVFRITATVLTPTVTTTSPLTDTATTPIKPTATAPATKGTATTATEPTATAMATKCTATIPTKATVTATATKATATAMATKGIATATNGRRKKRKYVSEADAINKGDRPAPMSHYPPRHIL